MKYENLAQVKKAEFQRKADIIINISLIIAVAAALVVMAIVAPVILF